jgi:hypothetical protein
MHNIAWNYQEQGKTAEAAELLEQVWEKSKAILGEKHPDTLASISKLIELYKHQGQITKAEKLQASYMGTQDQ